MSRVVRRVAAVTLGLLAAAAAAAQDGQALYEKKCAQCHGVDGDGQGVAAPYLDPLPRDFTTGKYKIRTTPSGALPTDEDLRAIIRRGMPYTSMPAWPELTPAELTALVEHLKSFSPEFAKGDEAPEALKVPKPPALTEESVAAGRAVYEELGCIRCHGEVGRGDGLSAPTLVDDYAHPIRAADLTAKWTFRGGATREDLFRTLTTGINGTPMPSYAEALADDRRWQLVDYIHSLSSAEEAPYAELLIVAATEEPLDLERGPELFDGAPEALFPIVGQIMQPGRNFHPRVTNVRVRALHGGGEIAFLVQWNDMLADTAATNDPTLAVPPFEPPAPGAPAEEAGEEDFWGVAEEAPAEDFWGVEEDAGGDDFWGADEADAPAGPVSPYSDAVAIQLPLEVPSGARKPYFLFGDGGSAVDLWYLDLGGSEPRQYTGRGSAALTPEEQVEIATWAAFEQGRWSVIFKRPLRAERGVPFEEGRYLPVAFTVWDGFNEERGNKRGLTQWVHLYVAPREQVSAVGPMARTGLGILAAELLLVGWLRWRRRARRQAERRTAVA